MRVRSDFDFRNCKVYWFIIYVRMDLMNNNCALDLIGNESDFTNFPLFLVLGIHFMVNMYVFFLVLVLVQSSCDI